MKCPKCGFVSKEADKFCSECGAPLKKECSGNKNKNFIYKKYACIISLVVVIMLILGSLLSNYVLNFIDNKIEKHNETTTNEDNYYVNDAGNVVVNDREYALYALNEMHYSVNSKWKHIESEDSSTFCDKYENSMTVAGRVYNDKVTDSVVEKFVDEFEESNNCVLNKRNCDISFDIPCSYYYCNNKNADGQHDYLNLYVFYQGNTMYSLSFDYNEKTGESEFEIDKSYILNDLSFDEITYTEPITTEPPTHKSTEPLTEKPTEVTITNNTSTDGFWAKGSGDYVATGLNVTRYGVLHIEYSGKGHFSVISYEGDDYDELLVNTTDDYSGDVLIDHSGSFSLEISASEGSWSISSSGLSIDDSTSFSGRGDSVTGLTSHDGGIWEITHNGSRHFSVIEYGYSEGYMDLLVNETGSYSGTVKAEAGDNIFFKVTADGEWSIKKK